LSLVLGLTGGWVTISTLSGSMDELIFDPNPHGSIGRIYTCERIEAGPLELRDDKDRQLYAWDEDALVDYLGGLQLRRLDSSIWSHGCSGYVLEIFYDSEGDIGRIMLNDDMLTVSTFSRYKGNRNMRLDYYQVTSPVDWDYIHSLLDYDAPDPDPYPVLPHLLFSTNFTMEDGESPFWMNGECLRKHVGMVTTEDPYAHWEEDGTCFFHGADYETLNTLYLDFSYDPDSFYIRVEPADGEAYEIPASELETGEMWTGDEGYILPLLEGDAVYHICGSFSSHRNTVFEMEFHISVVRESENGEDWEMVVN